MRDDMEKPLISVIVPVYNVEKYIKRCVESLVIQTYANFEIILVDDGSRDNCPQIVEELSKNYESVKFYHKKNGGLGDARNFGINRANGEWIVLVDSDDYVEPDYLSDLWDLKEEYNAEISMARNIQVDKDDNILGKKFHFDSYKVSGENAIWEIYVGNHVGWSACNKLYPKWVLQKYPFPKGYYEDMACMYKIVDEVDSIAIGDFNENYKYVQHTSGSILNSNLSEKHMHVFAICEEIEEYIRSKYPNIVVVNDIIYVKSVIQMLNRQNMSSKDFRRIFRLYRHKFRKSFIYIVKHSKVPRKMKVYTFLLCTEPWIYKMVYKIAIKMKRKDR